jgi:tellurite resistance protein
MKSYVVEVTATVIFRHEVEARTPKEAAAKLRRRLKANPELVAEGVVPAQYGATVEPEEFEVFERGSDGCYLRLVRDRHAA